MACPTRFGQEFTFHQASQAQAFSWHAFDHQGEQWLEAQFDQQGYLQTSTDNAAGQLLEKIFQYFARLKPGFWEKQTLASVVSHLDFPRLWGLGSSSTLIAALAQWAGVDAFELLDATLGGSGYDIACAQTNSPILYQRRQNRAAYVELPYAPAFADHLLFVYLGKKQDSRTGIGHYRQMGLEKDEWINKISYLTIRFLQSQTAAQLAEVMALHEDYISEALQLPKVKDLYFPDFEGAVKSLGAWGGDFILACSPLPSSVVKTYFQEKGFETILTFDELFF